MPARSSSPRPPRRPPATPPLASWRLEEAKARFSEVVRLARAQGPQHVTVHGQEAVVVLSSEEYARLAPAAATPNLAALFSQGPFTRLEDFDPDALRDRSPTRDAVKF